MGRMGLLAFLLLFISFAGFLPAQAQSPVPGQWAGQWEGSISIPGSPFDMAATFTPNGAAWTGTIDIQGAKGVPLGGIAITGESIAFEMTGVPGMPTFKGMIAADGKSIAGNFSQSGQTFPFKLQRPVPAEIVNGEKLVGIWEGTIPVGGRPIRLVFKVTKPATGPIVATFASPDQGSPEFSVTRLGFKDSAVRFTVPDIQGGFEGKLDAAGTAISGSFTQGGVTQPLVLKKTDKAAVANRPQEPKPPFPYQQVEVSYRNAKAGITLAGTLAIPQTPRPAPFPAVLLITGSGAQDRDESLLGHKPFLVLSDHLVRKGIAVLRVDDRGVGASTGSMETATTEDFAGDVMAGIEFLKGRKEIDATRIGLIGHSEGGVIAPMVASQSHDVAFIVLLAGPGVTGEEILYEQEELIQKAAGASAAELAASRAIQEKYYAVLKSGADRPTMETKLRALGNPQPEAILSNWFRFFLTYDPRPALQKTKCPVLAIGGERDLQVPARENLAAIEAALKAGKNPDYKAVALPNLNHLFQTSKTGAPSEYGSIEETMSPIALNLVSDWIVQHTTR